MRSSHHPGRATSTKKAHSRFKASPSWGKEGLALICELSQRGQNSTAVFKPLGSVLTDFNLMGGVHLVGWLEKTSAVQKSKFLISYAFMI